MSKAIRAANDNKPERIFVEDVSRILGLPSRTVQTMAVQGRLPSAAKVGRRWSFNENAVRALLKEEEARWQNEKLQKAPTGVMVSYGAAFASKVSLPSNGPLAQTILKLRHAVSKRSKLNSLAA